MKKALSTLLQPSFLAASFVLASSVVDAMPSQALQLGFSNITHNNSLNATAGESQLFVDITDALGGEKLSATQALFKFSNRGSAASSITQIYFDQNASSPLLKSISSITDSGDGVVFHTPNKNGNLPGGNSVNFTEDFTVDADQPVSQMGVNPGEFVSILFNLSSGKTLENVFQDLLSGSLRLGFHVQAFADGGSEAFVNKQSPVPPAEPAEQTPAEPVAQIPAEPAAQTPAEPVVETPVEPIVETPAEPVAQTPAASQKVPEPSSMGALLLAGVAAALRYGKRQRTVES